METIGMIIFTACAIYIIYTLKDVVKSMDMTTSN